MDLTTARVRLAGRGFDYLTTDQIDEALNTAKNSIEDAYPWPWLDATATGTAPLTITDLKQILYVVDATTDRRLFGMDVRSIAEQNASLDQQGDPMFWWIDGLTTLRSWPISSHTLNVRYRKFSPDLAIGGTETPLIPVRYHPVWIDMAVVEALKVTHNLVAAQTMLLDVNRRLEQMVAHFADRNLQNPDFMDYTFDSEDS